MEKEEKYIIFIYMELILKALKKTAVRALWLAVLLLFVGVSCVLSVYFNPSSLGMQITMYVLAAAFIVGALKFVVQGIRMLASPDTNELIVILRERPQEIAWAYETQVKGREATSGFEMQQSSLTVRMLNKKRFSLFAAKRDIKSMLEYVARTAPKAHIGYSEELEKMYRAHPASVMHAA